MVFDNGCFHPHHDLYFVTSDHRDLDVLGGLLSSRVALLCLVLRREDARWVGFLPLLEGGLLGKVQDDFLGVVA